MFRRYSQILQWSVVAVVVAAVVATGILTNVTLRSIEKNLPITLITELESLDNCYRGHGRSHFGNAEPHQKGSES